MRLVGSIISVLILSSFAAYAQDQSVKIVPASPIQMQMSFAPVVKKVTPGVVNIYAKTMVAQPINPLFNDPFFRQFFGGGMQMRPREANSLGSGVIVRADGLVVTNAHVAQNATEINVSLADKREFSAKTVLVDEKSDLALLQLDLKGQKLTALNFADSDTAEVGDLVLAIGNPFGVGQTVTTGIVSATARTNIGAKGFGYYIQTDAAINPGNSGGALVNMAGNVLGINTMIFSKSGGYMGIGFAVPANLVKQVVASYASGGTTVQRAWLGASLQTVTNDIAESMKLDRPKGALVQDVYDQSPADQAGIKRGDIILSMDGREIDDMKGVRYVLATQNIGDTVPVIILRDGREIVLPLPVSLPEKISTDPVILRGNHPLNGAQVIDLSPGMLEEMDSITDASKGVMIKRSGGIAARLGLGKGDIITSVNGVAITSAEQLQEKLDEPARGWTIVFMRGDQSLTLKVN